MARWWKPPSGLLGSGYRVISVIEDDVGGDRLEYWLSDGIIIAIYWVVCDNILYVAGGVEVSKLTDVYDGIDEIKDEFFIIKIN